MTLLALLAFFLSSAITFSLIYFKVSTTIIQQTIAILLVIFIILSRRFVTAGLKPFNKLVGFVILLLSSLFVQLLVISSGGFHSPFLILLHLFTLGTSFLLNIGSAIVFLILSLLLLISSVFLNDLYFYLFQQDPGFTILYLVSFIVIIPLAQYLMQTYHLKDTVSTLLSEHIHIGEKREQSILQGLSELVLVTDKNLKIVSANESLTQVFNFKGEVIGRNILEVVKLEDGEGKGVVEQFLSIDKILKTREAHIIKNLYLKTRLPNPVEVILQIKPVTDQEGRVHQMVFVITRIGMNPGGEHRDLEQARLNHNAIIKSLKQALEKTNLPELKSQAELFSKIEDDLFIALELEDHPVKTEVGFQDIAALCQQIVVNKQGLAKALNVSLQFNLPKEEVGEAALIDLAKSLPQSKNLPVSSFAVPTDSKWLAVVIQKLMDISLFLAKGTQDANIAVSLDRSDSQALILNIAGNGPDLTKPEQKELFQQYYGSLNLKTNLNLGSGLEGFIAKHIADELNIPIAVSSKQNYLLFQLKLTKNPLVDA